MCVLSDTLALRLVFAENLLKTLSDPDPQKNLLALATKVAEMQEQNRSTQSKIHELEKKSAVLVRERDTVLLENGRITGSKAKLESLCRELHQHNQQIRVGDPFLPLASVINVHSRMRTSNGSKRTKPNVVNWPRSFKSVAERQPSPLKRLQLSSRLPSTKLPRNYRITARNRPRYANKTFNYPNN